MKNLNDILKGINPVNITGNADMEISGISFDSRKVESGHLFVAVKGTETDGHNFISKAVENGAFVVVCEKNLTYKGITVIEVEDSAKALGIIASNFYDNPSAKLKLVGITGTNGKTTTATLLYRLFLQLGYKVGLISTVKNMIFDKEISATHTTPDVLKFNELLKQMADEACEYCFAEVSSHAIVQQRIANLTFAGGVFTNLTHEHLDYHKTFAEYIKAKKTFFDNLPKNSFALTNQDDKNGNIVLQNTKAQKYTYALRSFADYNAKVLENHIDGMLLNIDNNEMWSVLTGKFNAYNLLSVYATAVLLGEVSVEVLTQLSSMSPVKGRFETVKINEKTAIIDYAHTPDALLNVLETINELRKNGQELITVVGAGGDRDKSKRPLMAKAVADFSSKVILTSDNPRTENPETIIEDMYAGLTDNQKNTVLKITNRREAIKTACLITKKGDIILIAGKGHENYQEINGERTHFDDKETVTEFLK